MRRLNGCPLLNVRWRNIGNSRRLKKLGDRPAGDAKVDVSSGNLRFVRDLVTAKGFNGRARKAVGYYWSVKQREYRMDFVRKCNTG